jgi:hypothetical protein
MCAIGGQTRAEDQLMEPSESMVRTARSAPLNVKGTGRGAVSVPLLSLGRAVLEPAGVGTVPAPVPAPVTEQVRASDPPDNGSRQKYQRPDLGHRHHDRRLLSPRRTNATPRCADWGPPRHPLIDMCVPGQRHVRAELRSH